MRFGFWVCFGFWEVFWILGSVSDSGMCMFWILGSVLDSGKCFGILGSVLDSEKCFGFWEVFCPYEPPYYRSLEIALKKRHYYVFSLICRQPVVSKASRPTKIRVSFFQASWLSPTQAVQLPLSVCTFPAHCQRHSVESWSFL